MRPEDVAAILSKLDSISTELAGLYIGMVIAIVSGVYSITQAIREIHR